MTGNLEPECGAFTQDAADADLAAMRFYDGFANGKTKSCSFFFAFTAGANLFEFFKYDFQFVFRDTGALVDYLKLQFVHSAFHFLFFYGYCNV